MSSWLTKQSTKRYFPSQILQKNTSIPPFIEQKLDVQKNEKTIQINTLIPPFIEKNLDVQQNEISPQIDTLIIPYHTEKLQEINHKIEKNNFIDKIDAILYINLENRKDRNEHCLGEIKKIDPTLSKTYRIDAIYNKKNGAMGCSQSHIKAIEFFISHPTWNSCMILEDDFTFTSNDSNEINNILESVYHNVPDFDVLLLGLGVKDLQYTDTEIPTIKRVQASQTTSGYLFTRKYAYTLLSNFISGVNNMKQYGKKNNNCIDQYWKRLMPLANWYGILPRIGYQYANYSDIENKEQNYGC